jgi:hypothetical protein
MPYITFGKENSQKTIEPISLYETIKYLGVPIGENKFAKFKFAEDNFATMEKLMHRILDSGLKVTQIINAIKTFILPKLDYLIYNTVIRIGDLQKMDKLVRKFIKESIGGPPLSKGVYYSSWKDGGFGVPNLETRYSICKIVNLLQLLNNSPNVRHLITTEIRNFCEKNSLRYTNERNSFFGYEPIEEDIRIFAGGFNSVVGEAY